MSLTSRLAGLSSEAERVPGLEGVSADVAPSSTTAGTSNDTESTISEGSVSGAAARAMAGLPAAMQTGEYDPSAFVIERLAAHHGGGSSSVAGSSAGADEATPGGGGNDRAGVSIGWIDDEIDRYNGYLDAVTGQLSQKIMGSYSAFVEGMQHIHVLGNDLQMTSIICKNGRRSLLRAKDELENGGLSVVQNHDKRDLFMDVLHLLEEIARVQDLREDFNVAVEAGDFKVALDTLTEFRQAVAAARDVACIQSLAADSAGDFDKIEAAMEGVLRDSCKSIDPTQYGRAVYGFKEFGKLPLVRQHMAAFGPEVVAKRARHTVLSYVRAQTEDSKKRKAFRSLSFDQLCAALTEEQYVECLTVLLSTVGALLYNQARVSAWHSSDEGAAYGIDGRELMEPFRVALWEHVALYVSCGDVTNFQLKSFLAVLDAVGTFMGLAQRSDPVLCRELEANVRAQSRQYFDHWHHTKMENLRTMLENDMWQKCPVVSSFEPTDLVEFKTVLREDLAAQQERGSGGGGGGGDGAGETTEGQAPDAVDDAAFVAFFEENGNPFALALAAGSAAASDDVSVADATGGDTVMDEAIFGEDDGQAGPTLTSTTIKVARMIAQYASLAGALDTVADEVLKGMVQVAEFYSYTIFSFFGDEARFESDAGMPASLKRTLVRLRGWLGRDPPAAEGSTSTGGRRGRFRGAQISELLDLRDNTQFFGMNERVVGVESLAFVAACLRILQPVVLERTGKPKIHQRLNALIGDMPALQRHIYASIGATCLDLEGVVEAVTSSKWDIKSQSVQPKEYANRLVKELQQFSIGLAQTELASPDTIETVWTGAIAATLNMLIEAYSRVRKCSIAGRSQMQMDVDTLTTSISALPNVPATLPRADALRAFIQAYYIPEEDILDWANANTEFTTAQVLGLIQSRPVSGRNAKKARARIIQSIEQQEKSRQSKVTNFSS